MEFGKSSPEGLSPSLLSGFCFCVFHARCNVSCLVVTSENLKRKRSHCRKEGRLSKPLSSGAR